MSNSVTNMATDLQTLLRDRLNDKIRTSFIELIPEEQFSSMLDAAVEEFIHGPAHKRFKTVSEYCGEARGYVNKQVPIDGYSAHSDPGTLPGMLMEQLREEARRRVKVFVEESDYFRQMHPDDPDSHVSFRNLLSKAAVEAIKANSDDLMLSLVGHIVQGAFLNVQQQLRNTGGRIY